MARSYYNDGTKTVNPSGKTMRISVSFVRSISTPVFNETCSSITDGIQKFMAWAKERDIQPKHLKVSNVFVGRTKVATLRHNNCWEVLRLDPDTGKHTDEVLYNEDDWHAANKKMMFQEAAENERERLADLQLDTLVVDFAAIIPGLKKKYPTLEFNTKHLDRILAGEVEGVDRWDFEVTMTVSTKINWRKSIVRLQCSATYLEKGPGFELYTTKTIQPSDDVNELRDVASLMNANADAIEQLREVFAQLEDLPSVESLIEKLSVTPTRRLICVDKIRHVMKKEDVEKEVSALLDQDVVVTSQISKGQAIARCTIGKREYVGEAKNIDFAYRALLVQIRKEHAAGLVQPTLTYSKLSIY